MAAISTAILALRRDRRILKLPPYLSALLIIIGVTWLLLLPLNAYSRNTYVSENALLPGQVHTYFGGSEHNIFRAYRQEVSAISEKTPEERKESLVDILSSAGLKVGTQKFKYGVSGNEVEGENVYALLQGPRADATEAIVLIAAWKNMNGEINYSGVALVLTLARYFKRWSLWSKDIIFLISSDSTAGPQAWVDAYHDAHDPRYVASLPIKSGALQGAVAIDYPAGTWGHRFDKLHVVYDGINGQLPNLDLFNTAVSIASGQMGIGCTLQRMWEHNDQYLPRLQTMLRGMLNQGLGHATGPHSSFIPYHVDAITLQTVGDGWHDEMSLGRTVEGLFRSLNNLLEHLHQSFFFYLLMQANRFVSIGTYLPSAMLVAGSFTVMCIALWVQSGRPEDLKGKVGSTDEKSPAGEKEANTPKMVLIKGPGSSKAIVPITMLGVVERHLFLPFALLTSFHFLGLVPFYLFNHTPIPSLTTAFIAFTIVTLPLPYILANILPRKLTKQELMLLQCFTLLLLGLFLSALATLNFSLSLLIGLLSAPFSFIRPLGTTDTSSPQQKQSSSTTPIPPKFSKPMQPPPTSNPPTSSTIPSKTNPRTLILHILQALLLTALSPPVVIIAASSLWNVPGVSLSQVLAMATTGWWIHGLWTGVVVWLVWWPAWFTASFLVGAGAWF
ncbi:Glycosylphosphatidylinositol:protein transamidase, GAA1 component [Tothia fuscella]|uniref:Glycosylphosphatidylinositol:protein transamidase, GAA1 component n=1 Tax=Tothia fuscella TaxID=1048955 RepID=A0A9P4U1T8_9PEZI|nr:Glycosylphosphatidylinositol:protein transamidase, GAA1 component [Tothia fuscella]